MASIPQPTEKTKSRIDGRFAPVDAGFIEAAARHKMSGATIRVYLVLAMAAGHERQWRTSHNRLADDAGVSISQAKNALRELRNMGAVEWSGSGGGRGVWNEYRIIPLPIQEAETSQDSGEYPDKTSQNPDLNSPESRPKLARIPATHNNKNPNNKNSLNKNKGRGANQSLPTELDTPTFRAAWNDWEQYRRQSKKTLTPITVKRQIHALSRMGVESAVISIEQSITNGWAGLFPPRKESTNGQRQQSNHLDESLTL